MKVTQSPLTLCDPMDYTVHGILQARILEWVGFPFSRGSSQPRDSTQVSHIAGEFFTSWATSEAQESWSGWPIPSPGDLPNPGSQQGLLVCRWMLYQLSYEWKWNSLSHVSDSLWPFWPYSPWNSLGQSTGVGSLSLLQGIFPTQGSNPGLPHCRQILYQLSHKGKPIIN